MEKDTSVLKPKGSFIVWPFILTTLAMFGWIGYTIASTERNVVMSDWADMRCNVLIMFAAYYFKPQNDPKSAGEFAMDNFSFCMKTIVQDVMAVVMAPFLSVFGQHASTAGAITDMMNALREIIATIYNAFLSFIEPFFLKFQAIAYQLGITTQHLRNSFRKVSAIAISLIFSGLSIIKGMQNAIDFIIKVVMIILIVLVVLVIFLFFILFPFIPIILAVIAVIVAAASASVAATAGGMGGTFCFDPSTRVLLEHGSKPISEIVLGDVLKGGAIVEGTMVLDGTTSPLYSLNGIYVSGSHLVLGTNGEWHSVDKDDRAVPLHRTVPILYCLNTSNRIIPIADGTGDQILFRDWEEMDTDDEEAHQGWKALVSSILGGVDESERNADTFCLMDPANIVLTANRGIQIVDNIRLGDEIIVNGMANTTKVIGVVEGFVDGDMECGWMSSCIASLPAEPYAWKRITTNGVPLFVKPVNVSGRIRGKHLITGSGIFRVITPTGHLIVRDMTETGSNRIHETYDFVAASLRKNKSSSYTETLQ